MPAETDTDPAPPERPRETPRVRLARAVGDAVAACPGVAALDGGPGDRFSTAVGDERLPGVLAIADDPGAYAVSVFVRAELTDLRDLADRVRVAATTAAGAAGLADRLGTVRVTITDIDTGTVGP